MRSIRAGGGLEPVKRRRSWRRRLRRALNQRIGRGPIPRAAREILAGKRLTVSDHWTDVWREEHATAFTAARLTRQSLVEEVHRELVKALEAGETFEAFRGRIQPWLERRGWQPPARGGDIPTRLERIYRTNMKTARAAGRWHRIEESRQRLPYLAYRLGPSIEHRDQHVAWEWTILPVDDPWWDTHATPNGWGCQCWVYQMSGRKRDRLLAEDPAKYRTDAPELEYRDWVNPATREVRRVPAGIDPGWDHNVGKHRTLGIHRRDAERSEAVLAGRALSAVPAPAREQLVRGRIQHSLGAPGFRRFLNRPRAKAPPKWEARAEFVESVPVAVAPASLRTSAEVSRGLLYLPANIADKQWRRHGPGQKRPTAQRTVPGAWWADVQDIVDSVVPVRQRNGRWRYDDVARGRRLIVERDAAGRLVVISYSPRRVGVDARPVNPYNSPTVEPLDPGKTAMKLTDRKRDRIRRNLTGLSVPEVLHERRHVSNETDRLSKTIDDFESALRAGVDDENQRLVAERDLRNMRAELEGVRFRGDVLTELYGEA